MNIAVVSTHVRWTTHYATELELMERHLIKGDKVVQVVCNGELIPCDANIQSSSNICYNCIYRQIGGGKLLSGSVERVPIEFKTAPSVDVDVANLADVKAFHYKEFDVGYAALSSLISNRRRTDFDETDLEMLKSLISKGCAMFDFVEHFLDSRQLDVVYIFNGRFLYPRAVLRACQKRGIKVFVHERGHNIDHFELYENTLPHDLRHLHSRIVDYWSRGSVRESEREEVGSQFYLERRNGKQQSWFSFTKDQSIGKLPANWDSSKRNIVIFNSSEDEFASIGDEWRKYVFENQTTGILELARYFIDNSQIHFYLRVHPNLANVRNTDVGQLLKLRLDNLTIIPANSDVSTYAMVDAAEKIVTFGSTVGIEAVFWNKPSILLGSSFYRELGATYNPLTLSDLHEMILNDLSPLPKIGALMYGYYQNTFGIRFEYYKATDLAEGRFKNVSFFKLGKMPLLLRILRKLSMKHVPVWWLNRVLMTLSAVYL